MKQLITAFLLLISISGCSQKLIKDSTKRIRQDDFTEEQLTTLYKILKFQQQSGCILNSDNVSTKAAGSMLKFGDSLISVYEDQFYVWHRSEKPALTPMERYIDSVSRRQSDSLKKLR